MDKHIYELEKELREASEKLKIICDTVDKMACNVGADDIPYGSRVLITWENGETVEGRVLVVKGQGLYGINREGYAGTINLGVNHPGLTEHTLKNLSVGTYGKLEREKWVLTQEISALEKRLGQAIESRNTELLKTQISKFDINKIINSAEFKKWLIAHSENEDFPSIEAWPQMLRSAIAKEFLLLTNYTFIH